MKRIVIGMTAHADSGKTTLSEALLYLSGEIRKQGRVDHGDAFLDTHSIERSRGITVFSKQAVIHGDDAVFTLLDTPGHTDFSAEAERALSVVDYAVLVISGTDGVQSHTETLWRLLSKYNKPVFIFVNKMDISQFDRDYILSDLRKHLSDKIADFSASDDDRNGELVRVEGDEAVGHFEGVTFAFRIHHYDGSFLDHGQHRLVVGQDAHSALRGRNGNGLRRTVPHGVVGGDDVHLHDRSGHHAPNSFCMSCHFFSRSSMPPMPENACSGTSSYTPSQMRVKASMVSSAGT